MPLVYMEEREERGAPAGVGADGGGLSYVLPLMSEK